MPDNFCCVKRCNWNQWALLTQREGGKEKVTERVRRSGWRSGFRQETPSEGTRVEGAEGGWDMEKRVRVKES